MFFLIDQRMCSRTIGEIATSKMFTLNYLDWKTQNAIFCIQTHPNLLPTDQATVVTTV